MANLIAKLALFVVFTSAFSGQMMAQKVEVHWQHDLDAAVKQAAEQDKLILLHFTADWCRPCKSLETFVFNSPLVVAAMDQNVVPVKVDVDAHPQLVKEYGVKGVPFDIAVTATGRVSMSRKSPRSISGYTQMLTSLTRNNDLQDEKNPGAAKTVAILQEQYQPKKNPLLDNDFTPAKPRVSGPTHQAPAVSQSGQQLARINQSQKNPFFGTGQSGSSNPSGSNVARINGLNIQSPVQATIRPNNDFAPAGSGTSSAAVQNPHFKQDSVARVVVKNQFMNQSAGSDTKLADGMKTGLANQAAATGSRVQRNQFFSAGNARTESAGTANTQIASASMESAEAVADAMGQAIPTKPDAANPINQFAQAEMERPLGVQSTAGPAKTAKPPASKFALAGKCPVSLLKDGRWEDGNESFGCVHRGRIYLFASDKNLKIFQEQPDAYSPILAGYDPVSFHNDGKLVEGQNVHGVFMGKAPNKRVVLFESPATRAKFQSNPKIYLESVRQAMIRTDQQRILR